MNISHANFQLMRSPTLEILDPSRAHPWLKPLFVIYSLCAAMNPFLQLYVMSQYVIFTFITSSVRHPRWSNQWPRQYMFCDVADYILLNQGCRLNFHCWPHERHPNNTVIPLRYWHYIMFMHVVGKNIPVLESTNTIVKGNIWDYSAFSFAHNAVVACRSTMSGKTGTTLYQDFIRWKYFYFMSYSFHRSLVHDRYNKKC